jgi:AraC-like DNA-binding protein
VTDWAARLGWSRQTLWRVCRQHLGADPGQVLRWFVEAQVRVGRQHHFTLEALATMLGYADKASLAHALKGGRHPKGTTPSPARPGRNASMGGGGGVDGENATK